MDDIGTTNFQLFRECLSTPLIEKSSTKPEKRTKKSRGSNRRKTAIKPVEAEEGPNDAAELAEFIDYIAQEIFTNLPPDLRILTYTTWFNTPAIQAKYTDPPSPTTLHQILTPLPASILETLETYTLSSSSATTPQGFLLPILTSYISTLLTPPLSAYASRPLATSCEICERTWIPLTYHHLIPKGVHAKVLKRGWHTEDQLMNVAWLCRACHSFVHGCASLEELAREWFTVERLLEREDVRRFAKWVGGVRWKSK